MGFNNNSNSIHSRAHYYYINILKYGRLVCVSNVGNIDIYE